MGQKENKIQRTLGAWAGAYMEQKGKASWLAGLLKGTGELG